LRSCAPPGERCSKPFEGRGSPYRESDDDRAIEIVPEFVEFARRPYPRSTHLPAYHWVTWWPSPVSCDACTEPHSFQLILEEYIPVHRC
jgi:hypothetical protein